MAETLGTILLVLAACSAFVAWAAGGMKFRRWAVHRRVGQPRFPEAVETVLLWLIYSAGVSLAIALTLQVLRELP